MILYNHQKTKSTPKNIQATDPWQSKYRRAFTETKSQWYVGDDVVRQILVGQCLDPLKTIKVRIVDAVTLSNQDVSNPCV